LAVPARFDFYGTTVRVDCDDDEVRERIAKDFAWFRAPPAEEGAGASAALQIAVALRAPDYESLPPLKARVYTPRNICYPNGDVTYIDYFGRALAVYDRARSRIDVESEDRHLLHEIVFLSILSRVGEKLEIGHMHRVHALAVECNGEAALFMMPSGCGKTSLAMEFLRRDVPYRVVSEDSPLIDAAGRVLPFPLRFGVLGEKPEDVAEGHLTYVERMEFEPKYLISLDAFAGSIATGPSRPRFAFIGDRSLGPDCAIRPAGLGAGMKALLRHMVVGVGLYQGVEFLMQSSLLDLARGSRLFFSRFLRALSVMRQAELYALELGRDRGRNAATVLSFLESQGFGKGASRPSDGASA
jgi:hypothetical protein